MKGLRARHRTMQAASMLLCISLLLPLFSCQPSPHPPGAPSLPQARPKPVIDLRDVERKIHVLVNRERAKHGLAKLAWDDALARIARGHSRDMAVRAYFSHDTPDGKDFSYRYGQQGYSCQIRTGTTIHLGAENLALNHLYRSVPTVNGKPFFDWNSEDELAASTVQGWMDSPGHRKNILLPYWLNEGIGIHVSPADTVLITQNFC
jgi:uncharacterized protein YkwD